MIRASVPDPYVFGPPLHPDPLVTSTDPLVTSTDPDADPAPDPSLLHTSVEQAEIILIKIFMKEFSC
jgi:hypothetical protein